MKIRWTAGALPFLIPSVVAAAAFFIGAALAAGAAFPDPQAGESVESRLRELEDREEIRQLLVDYGRTIDQRDFGAFSGLFAKNAEYIGGGGTEAVRGPAAIAKSLEDIIRQNPTGFRSPSFHLFANEILQVNGDEATSSSKGIFVVPGENNQPAMVMLATYSDVLTREDGRWKFKKRVVHADIPAPPAPK